MKPDAGSRPPGSPIAGDLPQTERGRATRRALLDAAEDVFGELTYERASVSEITRRAGVAQGTFYVHFPDKKSVFIELLHRLNHDLRRAISEAVADLEDRIDIERVGFRTFFRFIIDHHYLYRIVRESEFVAPEDHRWHYLTLADAYRRGLEKAQGAGQIATDISAETMAWLLMGMAEMLGARYACWDRQPLPDQVFDDFMVFVTRAVGSDPASTSRGRPEPQP